MRTSDSNIELFAPDACATAGMISESGVGESFDTGVTGETRLTETGTAAPLSRTDAFPPPYEICTVPVCVSGPRTEVSAETSRVRAPAGTVPDDGVIVIQDLSAFAENVDPAAVAGMTIGCLTPLWEPTSVVTCF